MATLESNPAGTDVRARGRASGGRLTSPADVATFVLVAAGVVLYSLRGGSYDLVVRQELGLAIWWILALGFATGLLPRSRLSPVAVVAVGAFALLSGLFALALTYTQSDERTVNELARLLHHAGLVVLVIAVLDKRSWRVAAAGLAAGGVAVCVLALASRLWPGPFPIDAVNRQFPGNRLNYPFGYWNAIAAFSVMTTTLALGFSAHARHAAVRALALAPVPLIVGVNYLTYSRGGVVALAVGLVVLVASASHRGLIALHVLVAGATSAVVIAVIRSQDEIANNTGTTGAGVVALACLAAAAVCAAIALGTAAGRLDGRMRLPPRIARIGVGVGLVAVLAAGVVAGPDLADRAIDGLRAPPALTGSSDPAARLTNLSTGRYEHWAVALDTFSEQPFHGIGPGTFEFAWNRSDRYTGFVRDAHSLYFEALAEEGWIGFLGILLVIGAILVGALVARIRLRPDPATAGLAGGLLTAFVVFAVYAGYDWMWESTAVAAFGLAAGAVLLAAGSRARLRAVPVAARAALTVIALLVALVEVPGLAATSEIRGSQKAVRDGDLEAAFNHAEDAVTSSPWAASPYVQRGLVLERSGELPAAERDIQRAWKREPTNYRHPLLLARIDALSDRPQAALRAFRAAKRLAPRKAVLGGSAAPQSGQPDEP